MFSLYVNKARILGGLKYIPQRESGKRLNLSRSLDAKVGTTEPGYDTLLVIKGCNISTVEQSLSK